MFDCISYNTPPIKIPYHLESSFSRSARGFRNILGFKERSFINYFVGEGQCEQFLSMNLKNGLFSKNT